MKKIFHHLLQHPYIRGSSLNFIGSLGVNFLSYIFNIIIGRFLGPQVYSEYFSLISIWYLAAMPASVLQTVLTKQVAHHFSSHDSSALRETVLLGIKYGIWWGVGIALLVSLLSPFMLTTLKSSNLLALLLIALLLFISYITGSMHSYFMGKERYLLFALLSGLSIFGRLFFVVPFILLQNSVVSVLLAMLVGALLQLFVSTYLLYRDFSSSLTFRHMLLHKTRQIFFHLPKSSSIYHQISHTMRTTFIATFGLAALTQVDVIFARSRLSAEEAGIYASLAVTGKIIPFFTLPLISVLLPQLTARVAKGQKFKNTILLASTLVFLGAGSVATFYAIFPEFVIHIFLGDKYIASAQYLTQFSIFQMLYALTSLGVLSTISLNHYRHASAIAIFAVIQVLGILFLPPTIISVISASILSTFLATLYYFYILFFNTSIRR